MILHIWPFFSFFFFFCELILLWGHRTCYHAPHNFPPNLGNSKRGLCVCVCCVPTRVYREREHPLQVALCSWNSSAGQFDGVDRMGDDATTILYGK